MTRLQSILALLRVLVDLLGRATVESAPMMMDAPESGPSREHSPHHLRGLVEDLLDRM